MDGWQTHVKKPWTEATTQALEAENANLKRRYAEPALENTALKDLIGKRLRAGQTQARPEVAAVARRR